MDLMQYSRYTINDQIDLDHRARNDFLKSTLNISDGHIRQPVAIHMFEMADAETKNITDMNISISLHDHEQKEYIFDRTDVRAVFITLYSLVFCCCFFGNLLVILVVTLSRRLRSITNFFLANLAVADLCVGVFCVFQNLSIYLIPSWIFGDFLCKMYQFVHSLSYTASIFILVVICTERYFAIIHPITCKQILTPRRLRLVIVGVWITSALYSAPKFMWMQTITNDLGNGQTETICIMHRKKYDSELYDMINFGLLYVTPLCVMTVLYTLIAVGLWRSANTLQTQLRPGQSHQCQSHQCLKIGEHRSHNNVQSEIQVQHDENGKIITKENPGGSTTTNTVHWRHRGHSRHCHLSHLSQNVLRARRGVIRMLIVVVLTFALCNLPLHARKMWQNWSYGYKGDSNFSTLFTPLTFLISYFNSGINPLLYAFLSRNFRKGMKELLFCSCQRSNKMNLNKAYHNQGGPLIQGSILRRSSTRSTRANCSTVTTAPNGHGDT